MKESVISTEPTQNTFVPTQHPRDYEVNAAIKERFDKEYAQWSRTHGYSFSWVEKWLWEELAQKNATIALQQDLIERLSQ